MSTPDRTRKPLKTVVQQRLLQDMIGHSRQTATDSPGAAAGYLVLVMDQRATRVISSALRMYDVMEGGLALVDKLENRRQPMPELEVIYFIEPSLSSVRHIVKDFTDQANPMYADVHLFFTSRADDDIIAYLKRSPFLVSRVRSLVELNLDFLTVESNTFSLDMQDSMVSLFEFDGGRRREARESIVDKLVTLCATLNEYPFVRFQGRGGIDNEGTPLPEALAAGFHASMNEFLQANQSFWYHGDDGVKRRSVLLIVDRCVDLMAPLMHEFTYQAMVNDLLEVEGEKFRYRADINGQVQDKTILLNEKDALWKENRHLHIADVIGKLGEHLNEFMQSNAGRLASREVTDLSTMAAAVKDLPEYQEMRNRHAAHVHVTKGCMDAVRTRRLRDCAILEQILVTGVDETGDSVRRAEMKRQLSEMLQDDTLSVPDKVRMVGLFIVAQGMSRQEKKELMPAGSAIPTAVQTALLNLRGLGVQMQTGVVANHPDKRGLTARNKAQAEAAKYASLRYMPQLKAIVESCGRNDLSEEAFPFVIPPPPGALPVIPAPGAAAARSNSSSGGGGAAAGAVRSVRRHRAKWGNRNRNGGGGNGSSNGGKQEEKRGEAEGRVIVFVAGGATFSELRAMYELMGSAQSPVDIIVGATHTLTPASFIDSLARLDGSNPAALSDIALDVAPEPGSEAKQG